MLTPHSDEFDLGPMAQMTLTDPVFSDIMWRLTPASMAVRLTNGRYQAWDYIQLLSRKLVDLAMGRCPRLIVCMPPRHGKSVTVSHWFPTWLLETFHGRRVILASYEAEFAAKWGGKVRDTIAENKDLLSVRFKTKNPAMHNWETSEDGAMMCAGVGGPITGKGANVLIIDDYVKNAEDANSLTMRNKTWDWWTSTARTRIEPYVDKDGTKTPPAVVVMATRWHSDDLIGRLIDPAFANESGEREEWEMFVFPACADPATEAHYRQFGVKVNDVRTTALSGKANAAHMTSIRERLAEADNPAWRDILGRKFGQPLCPDRFGEKELALFRGTSLRDWYALYQQRPGDEAEDGNVYHRFDERVNCRALERDRRMQLFVSMDFNVDPMSTVIGQYDPGSGIRGMERCEILEELVIPDSNTPDMMNRLLAELQKYRQGYTLSLEVFGDAAGTQRVSNSRKTNWAIVADYFRLDPTIHTRFLRRKTNPRITERVDAVNTMLMAADQIVRLYIDDRRCPCLVNDFKKVRWQEDSSGNTHMQLDKSDKKLTHISDALGYAIEYKFGLTCAAGGRSGLMQ